MRLHLIPNEIDSLILQLKHRGIREILLRPEILRCWASIDNWEFSR